MLNNFALVAGPAFPSLLRSPYACWNSKVAAAGRMAGVLGLQGDADHLSYLLYSSSG